MEETWKPIPSKPGMIASSLGRVRLPERLGKTRGGGSRIYRTKPVIGTVCRASKNARHTYLGLCNRTFGTMKIHRLVCEAFHGPSPFDGAVVIHIDENAHNNRPENLRWGTQKENLNMPLIKEYHRSRTGENSPRAKWAARQV